MGVTLTPIGIHTDLLGNNMIFEYTYRTPNNTPELIFNCPLVMLPVCLVSEPSQSLASHRRVRGAYCKINGVNSKQVTGRCGKEGFLLIKQEKAFDVALGTCSLMGEPL